MIHVVTVNETIESIAQNYGVSPARLSYDNQMELGTPLVVGQALLILIPTIVHTVVQGDTMNSIAQQYGITQLELIRRNPYLLNAPLYPEEQLIIQYQEQDTNTIYPYGYAYPFINKDLLREELLFLTALYCFSFGFLPDGTLVRENHDYLLDQAKMFGVAPVLVLTPYSENDAFDSGLINDLITNPAAQEVFISQLITELGVKGYTGVDMDFEYITRENREGYSDLIRRLSARLHSAGFTLSVAVAPKTSRDQPGLLYEGHDYAALGQYADNILLMTYEWGYTYGPPMAVAPLPNVQRVLNYALTEINPMKISIGIPNYGYDWPLPYQKGVTVAQTIGNVEAVNIARRVGAEIQYDSVAQTPFFTYTEYGVNHEVWFEDVRSTEQKLNLIPQYGLRGAGWWNLLRPFRPNWFQLDQMFRLRVYNMNII